MNLLCATGQKSGIFAPHSIAVLWNIPDYAIAAYDIFMGSGLFFLKAILF
jgi:hypothetical protein